MFSFVIFCLCMKITEMIKTVKNIDDRSHFTFNIHIREIRTNFKNPRSYNCHLHYKVILASDFLSIGRNAVRLFSISSTAEREH